MTAKDLITQKSSEFNALYERYAPQLEAEHHGEWVAMCPGEALVLGGDEQAVRDEAGHRFAGRDFALWRVGHIPRWRRHQ